jgi:hypothetical protein
VGVGRGDHVHADQPQPVGDGVCDVLIEVEAK